MIVTAFLAWFDEPVDQLRAAVRSTGGLCDRIVALDGGYIGYPRARPTSPKAQKKAILEAAADVGVEACVREPEEIWAGQCQKRTALLRAAVEWGADWLVGLDADYVLHHDADDVRGELKAAAADIGSFLVPLWTPIPENWTMADVQKAAPGKWHVHLAGKSMDHRLILRALPEMRYEGSHWFVSGLLGDERVSIMGPPGWGGYPAMRATEMRAHYVAEHRCFWRRKRNLEGNREFCKTREMIVALTGKEDVE